MLNIRRILWDDWNVAHVARHHVIPQEAEEVCYSDYVLLQGHSGRYVLIGPTRANRMLAVVVDHEGEGEYYMVTTRSASRKERAIYRQAKGGRT